MYEVRRRLFSNGVWHDNGAGSSSSGEIDEQDFNEDAMLRFASTVDVINIQVRKNDGFKRSFMEYIVFYRVTP